MTSRYSRLRTAAGEEEREEDEEPKVRDRRFEDPGGGLESRVPWRSLALAAFLLVFGALILLIAYLILSGHMQGERSQGYGLLFLGSLLFVPGFYESRIAYYTWREMSGYSFDQIPSY